MTLTELKTLFRRWVKVVPGGPTDKTRGQGMLTVLDALATELKAVPLGTTIIRLDLPGANILLTNTAPDPQVQEAAWYTIDGDWNATGSDARVYVSGLSATAFSPVGILRDGLTGALSFVAVDVVAATAVPVRVDAYTKAETDVLLAVLAHALTDEATTRQQADAALLSVQQQHTQQLTTKADLVNGTVPASQLPAYVDDVLEAATFAALPALGETGKIYVVLDTNKQYRWSGSTYVEIGKTIVLYAATGQSTDGAMTQKATTDALKVITDVIPSNATAFNKLVAVGDLAAAPKVVIYRGTTAYNYGTLPAALGNAVSGDIILVYPGGTGTDNLGRRCYIDPLYINTNVWLKFMPGAIQNADVNVGNPDGNRPFAVWLEGGEFRQRVILNHQTGGKSLLLHTNASFTGTLGGIQTNAYNANETVFSNVDVFTLRGCQVLADARIADTGRHEYAMCAPIRHNGLNGQSSQYIILENTVVVTTNTACITYTSPLPSKVFVRGGCIFKRADGGELFQSEDFYSGTVKVPTDQWLVDERTLGGSTYTAGTGISITGNVISATGTGSGTGYTDEQAQDAIAALLAAGAHSGITFAYDDANNKLSATVTAGGSGATYTAGTGIAISAGNVISATVLAGTGTVLAFDADREYSELFSGTFTFDTSTARLGAVVRARLGASAAAPAIPASGFSLLGGAYASGKRNLYSFCVAPGGVIEYYITQLV